MSRPRREIADPTAPFAAHEALSHLDRARDAFLEQRTSWERRLAELEQALSLAGASNRELAGRLEEVEGRLEEERRRAARFREREERLAAAVKDFHRGLFAGDIPDLILRASLRIAGATRGVYVGWQDGRPAVRASVGVDAAPPGAPAGGHIAALCARVERTREAVTVGAGEAAAGGAADPPAEPTGFRNCAAIPVFLRGEFDGVTLVADREEGDFDAEDVEALLSIGDQAGVAIENARLQRELEAAYLSTISTLADAVEAKDPSTHGHCEMVSRLARLTAERLGLPERERAVVCYAALLHDVGKIGVSDGVLNKPGPLLPEERDLVRAHVRVGHDLLRNVPALGDVARAVLHHHEWYDGSGYPDGLRGDDIPIAARVVCAVDAFGAMVSRRSYKEAYTEDYARGELRRNAGSQFDPLVVDAFLDVLDSPEARASAADEGAGCGVLSSLVPIRGLRAGPGEDEAAGR